MVRQVIELLRLKHWIKNFFVLFPLLFSITFFIPELVARSLLAAGAFCLASSACYIVNDVLDRKKDREHPVKKNRPLAAGKIGVRTALAIALPAALAALALALAVNPWVLLAVGLYLFLSVAYSLFLKHLVIIDVFAIAFGFVIRVAAGAFAIGVPLSNWFLLATFFLSLFMGFGKRRHDLLLLEESEKHRPVLEHYSVRLLDTLIVVAVTLVVATYSLYTVSPETVARFDTSALILTVPFVVFGVARYLYLVYKKEDGGDPADIVLKDASLIITVGLWLAAVIVILSLKHFGPAGSAG